MSVDGILLLGIFVGGFGLCTYILFGGNARAQNKIYRDRKAINNALADLIVKGSITFTEDYDPILSKQKDYRPVHKLEKYILSLGFGMENSISAKGFHINLRKQVQSLNSIIDLVDPKFLDFETKPETRINQSPHDLEYILPLIIMGNKAGTSSSDSNDSYNFDGGYSAVFSDSGTSDGDSGGDGGGGDGD